MVGNLLPAVQIWVLASTPILLALVCPISMLVMMFMMKGKDSTGGGKDESIKSSEAQASAQAPVAAPNKA